MVVSVIVVRIYIAMVNYIMVKDAQSWCVESGRNVGSDKTVISLNYYQNILAAVTGTQP